MSVAEDAPLVEGDKLVAPAHTEAEAGPPLTLFGCLVARLLRAIQRSGSESAVVAACRTIGE